MNFDTLKEEFFSLDGRLSRWEYFKRTIKVMIAGMVLGMLCAMFLDKNGFLYNAINSIWSFAIFCIGVTLAARRLHDLNHSGWWQLIGVIPSMLAGVGIITVFSSGVAFAVDAVGAGIGLGLFGGVVMFAGILVGVAFAVYLWLCKGTTGDNDYGPDPLAEKNR